MYSVWYEGNNGEVILQASGMTLEQAEKLAKGEAALSIDTLDGQYVVKEEIVIGGQHYALPEGFTLRKTLPVGEEIYDETGRACILYDSGYTSQVGDDQPYITTSAQTGKRRIPLQKVTDLGK